MLCRTTLQLYSKKNGFHCCNQLCVQDSNKSPNAISINASGDRLMMTEFGLLPRCEVWRQPLIVFESSLFAPITLAALLRLEHFGELLNEIHDEQTLVAIQPLKRVRDRGDLIVRPLRSTLQQLIYRTV